jgi:uncharacterized ParB-like nuclease family protein
MSLSIDSQTHPLRRLVQLALIDRMESARQIDQQTVRRLVESISAYGLLQPLVVLTKADGRFDCVAGNHRLEAIREACHEEAECLILPERTPIQDALACSLHENHVRADESLPDTVRRLTAYQQYSGCKSRAGAARLAGLSASKASKTYFAVDNLSPPALAFAAEHYVGVSVSYEIARRASGPDEQLRWLQAHVRGEMTRDQIVDSSRHKPTKAAARKPRPPQVKPLTVAGVINNVRIRLAFPEQLPAAAVSEALALVTERFREHVSKQLPPATFSIS